MRTVIIVGDLLEYASRMKVIAEMTGHPKGTLVIMEDEIGNYLVFAAGRDVTDRIGGLGVDPETLLGMAAELWEAGMF